MRPSVVRAGGAFLNNTCFTQQVLEKNLFNNCFEIGRHYIFYAAKSIKRA